MSNIEKSIKSTLEHGMEYIDFGDPFINDVFANLDSETKSKITKHSDKEVQKQILTDMSNPQIIRFYDQLSEETKKKIDATANLNERYRFLKYMMKQTNFEENPVNIDEKKSIPYVKSPHTPEDKSPHTPEGKPPGRPLKTPSTLSWNTYLTVRQEREQQEREERPKQEMQERPKPEPYLPKKDSEELPREAPQELFAQDAEEEVVEQKEKRVSETPQERFNKLVKTFYNLNPFVKHSSSSNYELEVKFGTKRDKYSKKGENTLTKNDYDNVIKKLKSNNFVTNDASGLYYLRMNCEFLDSASGTIKLSDVRVEIEGLHNIQEYCKHNDIKMIQNKNPMAVKLIKKRPAFVNNTKIFPVDFSREFNFRITMSSEEPVKMGIKNYILGKWQSSKKVFRYINRVTFQHKNYPVLVDISIVKYSNKGSNGEMMRVYTTNESNVFENEEIYEIEIEVDNSKIGPGTAFNSPEKILDALRKVTKYVLGGLQGTNYPISYPEQKHVLNTYMSLIWKDEFADNKRVFSKHFIGPNSITLQMVNIAQLDENSTQPNIRQDFVVTDKADGDRHLLYVSNEGKIYLINTNMNVIFTGAKTLNEDCFNVLIDGELILHDKNGKFINLYAAFDIYYAKKVDLRHLTFMLLKEELDINKSRYYVLQHIVQTLNAVSVVADEKPAEVEKGAKALLAKFTKSHTHQIGCPIRISCKEFYPKGSKETIFNGCNEILKKEREGRFEYNTDGLIFTHKFYGVGSNIIGKSGPKTKITWENSFKWKPPKYNTIDFLVTTIKDNNNSDVVKPLFEDGVNVENASQISEYKQIELRCGFSESKDGFINPCQDVIDDNLPKFVERTDEYTNDYLPKKFYPTEPYDPKAGLTKIMLKPSASGTNQMITEENEVFGDNMIVEFSYDFDKSAGWRWVPLRVRYDKTSRYLKGESEYGNSYKTCNENWKSIHNPITEYMISSGMNIPDSSVSKDIYYNTPLGDMLTESMKNFHNLYVKKMLIKSVTNHGDTLIDYACGKAGDLHKWIASRLSFVFGIDFLRQRICT
jgi:hypothetical protein